MFGLDNAYLLPELLLMIVTKMHPDYRDLLRLASVSTEWRSFVYGWNQLRKMIFLPLSRGGIDAKEIRLTPVNFTTTASIHLDNPWKTLGRASFDGFRKITPWDIAEIHPLVYRFCVDGFDLSYLDGLSETVTCPYTSGRTLKLSYQFFRCLERVGVIYC